MTGITGAAKAFFLTSGLGPYEIPAIETGLLTPPFGILVFTVRAALPAEASVGGIFRACTPNWIRLMSVIVCIAVWPQLAAQSGAVVRARAAVVRSTWGLSAP
jgi:hypothetical protein